MKIEVFFRKKILKYYKKKYCGENQLVLTMCRILIEFYKDERKPTEVKFTCHYLDLLIYFFETTEVAFINISAMNEGTPQNL